MKRAFAVLVLYGLTLSAQAPVNPRSVDGALDGQLALWNAANSRLQWGYDIAPGSPIDGSNRRYGIIYNAGVKGFVAAPRSFGDDPFYDCADLVGTSIDATATEPHALTFQGGGSAGCIHGNTMWLTGKALHFQSYGAITQVAGGTASARVFLGISDQTSTTMVGADDPAGNYAGFQWLTGGGSGADGNFKCISKDNTTQQVTDSGVAGNGYGTSYASRVGRHFDVVDEGSTYKFYIDGVLKCTHSTHVPTSGTLVTQMWAVGGQGGVSLSEGNPTYMWVEADNK